MWGRHGQHPTKKFTVYFKSEWILNNRKEEQGQTKITVIRSHSCHLTICTIWLFQIIWGTFFLIPLSDFVSKTSAYVHVPPSFLLNLCLVIFFFFQTIYFYTFIFKLLLISISLLPIPPCSFQTSVSITVFSRTCETAFHMYTWAQEIRMYSK